MMEAVLSNADHPEYGVVTIACGATLFPAIIRHT